MKIIQKSGKHHFETSFFPIPRINLLFHFHKSKLNFGSIGAFKGRNVPTWLTARKKYFFFPYSFCAPYYVQSNLQFLWFYLKRFLRQNKKSVSWFANNIWHLWYNVIRESCKITKSIHKIVLYLRFVFRNLISAQKINGEIENRFYCFYFAEDLRPRLIKMNLRL